MARETTSIVEYCRADSPFLTEFRRLLHRIRHIISESDIKTLLVSSSLLGEGKTTVCSILGVTSARKGLKTLVVDCDLRKPRMHSLFKLPRKGGMTEILTAGKSVKHLVKKSSQENLDILTAGTPHPHVADILDLSLLGDVFEELKFYYDLIFIDSPPVIPVSDPMLLASKVDGVMLVVKAGVTRREVVRRAVEILSSNGSKLLGTVLNDTLRALPSFYSADNYHYSYKEEESGEIADSASAEIRIDSGSSKSSDSLSTVGRRKNHNPLG